MDGTTGTTPEVGQHGHRGLHAEAIGHRARTERLEGERQGQAASRIAHERNAARRAEASPEVEDPVATPATPEDAANAPPVYGGDSYAAVVSAVFVSVTVGVGMTLASGSGEVAEPAPAEVQEAPGDATAPEEAAAETAVAGYQGSAMFVSAQMTYTSASIALALMQN